MKQWGHYHEISPATVATLQQQTPIAYLPWGSLEWHGAHLPYGVDGIIAHAMSERIAAITGGVVLPTSWWSVTTLPHTGSLSVRVSIIRNLWEDIFKTLHKQGWHIVVVVNGHYAHGHELTLIAAAEEIVNQYNILVLAVSPLAMVDVTMLDHAALWETSLMLALRPDLVTMSAIPDGALQPETSGIIGSDPRGTATASLGKQALHMATHRVACAVQQLNEERNSALLYSFYQQRKFALQPFVETYNRGSLEEATSSWWRAVCLDAKHAAEQEHHAAPTAHQDTPHQ